ncbi:MAG: histidine phosphatase family protein [Pirellulales bacterium]
MFKLLLIRPGVTEYDQQGRIQGTLDIPLCEDGRRQVDTMIEQLRNQSITAIYTCPSQAALQTADALGDAFDVKVKTIDTLQNLDHGLWQGMLVADVKAKQPKVYRQWQDQPETVCPPQGETVIDVEDRLTAAVTKLTKKYKADGLVAIVLPEPAASVLKHVLRKDGLGDLWKCRNGSTPWEIIEFAPETVGSK